MSISSAICWPKQLRTFNCQSFLDKQNRSLLIKNDLIKKLTSDISVINR